MTHVFVHVQCMIVYNDLKRRVLVIDKILEYLTLCYVKSFNFDIGVLVDPLFVLNIYFTLIDWRVQRIFLISCRKSRYDIVDVNMI